MPRSSSSPAIAPGTLPAAIAPGAPPVPSPFRHVLVLHDEHATQGAPDASEVLVEAAHVANALRGLGIANDIVPVGLDLRALERRLVSAHGTAVLNLVESLAGRAALIHVVP